MYHKGSPLLASVPSLEWVPWCSIPYKSTQEAFVSYLTSDFSIMIYCFTAKLFLFPCFWSLTSIAL